MTTLNQTIVNLTGKTENNPKYYFLFPTCTNFVFTYFMAPLLLLSQLRFNAKIVILIKGVNRKSSGQILEPIFDTPVCLVVCF